MRRRAGRAPWPRPATRRASRGCGPCATAIPAVSARPPAATRCAGPRSSWPPRAACSPTSPSATSWSCWTPRPARTARPRATARPVLPAAAPDGDLRPGRRRRGCGSCAPPGQRTPEELIDRYQPGLPPGPRPAGRLPAGTPARAGLRQPGAAGPHAGQLFWADLEAPPSRHRQPAPARRGRRRVEAAAADQAARPSPRADGEQDRDRRAARISYRECLTPVRAFYLDLAQWAVEDPARWGPWVAPCPVGREEISQRKVQRHRKSRMDARTRERLPVLPVLVRSAAAAARRRRRAAGRPPASARPGDVVHRRRADPDPLRHHAAAAASIWADDPATGKRRDLTTEEDHAFWAWATVEVLRATGIRVEELVELSHHSLVQYRLPATGELVPLLQIAPSKTDAERLLVGQPRTRRRAQRHHQPRPRHRPGRPARRRLRRPRARLAAARPAAVPAAHRRREPRDPRRHHPQACSPPPSPAPG